MMRRRHPLYTSRLAGYLVVFELFLYKATGTVPLHPVRSHAKGKLAWSNEGLFKCVIHTSCVLEPAPRSFLSSIWVPLVIKCCKGTACFMQEYIYLSVMSLFAE